jgi:hypothetical protein
MNTIRYLYVEDEKKKSVMTFIDALMSSNRQLSIEYMHPVSFYKNYLGGKIDFDCDGIILDLRLDLLKDLEGEKFNLQGYSLAQELKIRFSENNGHSIPVVLFSSSTRLKKMNEHDFSSTDLFDKIYKKDNLATSANTIADELVSFANVYKSITGKMAFSKNKKLLCNLLSIKDKELDIIDPQLAIFFAGKKAGTVHDCARAIYSYLIMRSGPLIDEMTLAARLGIDFKKSSDWKKLLNKIKSTCCYTGEYSDILPRWWSHGIESLWIGFTNSDLRSLTANERVQILKKKFKLYMLIEATPIEESYSTKFWTICKGYELPLDPRDAFMVSDQDLMPWNDKPYISKKAALKRIKRNEGIHIHPLEIERYKEYAKKATA